MRNGRSTGPVRKKRGITAIALLSAAITIALPVQAQNVPTAPSVAAPPPTQCPSDELSASPIAARLRELALQPGVRIEPATFMQDPQVAEFVGKVMQQEQVRRQRDWSGLCRYRTANAAIMTAHAPDVVFLGDSITENWGYADPGLFTDKVVDRGISGQTSSQILLRFYPDVIALRPKVVHIMAGTNDILHDAGPVGDDDIINNIRAMIDLAHANRIRVVLASIPPISVRSWQPALKPAPRLIGLNQRLKALAAARGIGFVDYFTALKDPDNGLRAALGNDGVHPNRAGYAAMRPLTERAISDAMQRRR